MHTCRYSWFIDITLLIIGFTILFGLFLGLHPLGIPDEARYAEIPREMILKHNYITPYLNGIKYFEKPVLFYWLQVAAIKAFGLSEWAVRFVNALMGLFTCIIVYCAGRLLFDRRTGLLASLMLATSTLFFGMAHVVTLDMTFSALVTTSLLAFLVATQQTNSHIKRYSYYSSYLFAALAILTKGLIGLIFPLMIIGSWILLLNQWRLLKECYLLSGFIIILLVAAPWHVLVQLHNPEFFNFYFIDQHFLRYLTKTSGRNKPFWFFIAVFMGGLLPWLCFLPQAIKNSFPLKHNGKLLFLLLWTSLIFLFYAFSNSKLAPYLLPIFPALALIIGHYFSTQWEQTTSSVSLRCGYLALATILSFLFIAFAYATQILSLANQLPPITYQIGILLGVWMITALLAYYWSWRGKQSAAFRALFYGTVTAYLIAASCMSKLDIGSIKPFTEKMLPYLTTDTIVVSYDNYYQDLPYYLKRRVMIANWRGELKFGMLHQDTHDWMVTDQQFWPLWQSNKPVFVVMPKKTFIRIRQNLFSFCLMDETAKDVLITNQKSLCQ